MACCTRNCSLLPFLSSSFSLVRRSFLQTQLRPLVEAGGSGCSQSPGLLLARHISSENCSPGEKVIVNFVNQDGVKTTVSVAEGESLLDVVINKNLDISGFGACEGTLACSTCHLIFEENIYKKLEPALDEEIDMLDLSYGLTKTSRLGCQVCVQKWMEGMTVRVPQDVKDMRDTKVNAKPMTS